MNHKLSQNKGKIVRSNVQSKGKTLQCSVQSKGKTLQYAKAYKKRQNL